MESKNSFLQKLHYFLPCNCTLAGIYHESLQKDLEKQVELNLISFTKATSVARSDYARTHPQ